MDISREEFLQKYNISQSFLEEHKIDWDKLETIYDDYIDIKEKLKHYAGFIAELLRNQDKVHTVRSRIKDPEHLIAKLIRKTPDRKEQHGTDFEFNVENYRNEITDLVGVRVIHIFKEDWQSIHNFVHSNWEVTESQANIREGDDQEQYTTLGVEINPRETGYRSVHYLIEFQPTKEVITAEIQVRTIFEEGYGEIDHQLSYPSSNIPRVLILNLLMLNRLAGSADEMASAVKSIKNDWKQMQFSLKEKENELEKLKAKIEKLDIEQDEKSDLVEDIGNLRTINVGTLGKNLLYIGNDLKIDGIKSGFLSNVADLKIDGIKSGLLSNVADLKIDGIKSGLLSNVADLGTISGSDLPREIDKNSTEDD